MTTAAEWCERFAGRLGVEAADAATIDVLLAMAGKAAHASERTAAPVSAWLAGRAGVTPTEALAHATALAAEIASDAAPPSTGDSPGA
jgi:hypothetical protein